MEHPKDAKKIINAYQLKNSRLLFSIAALQTGTPLPITYTVSSVFSQVITAYTKPKNNNGNGFRCSPKRGNCFGSEEILMVIPKVDKRKRECIMHFLSVKQF